MRHVRQPKATTMVGRDAKHLRSISKTPFAGIDRNARIAVVHDWCPNFRGGEQVLARICRIFPRAEVFTLFDFLPKEIKEEYFPGVIFHVSGKIDFPSWKSTTGHCSFSARS